MSDFDDACRAQAAKLEGRTTCPHCKDDRLQEYLGGGVWLCSSCSKTYAVAKGKA